MNVVDALNFRSSIRAFKPDSVDKETILKILEAATRAPSWANTQPWEIFVAGGEVLERLRHAFLTNFHNDVHSNPDLPRPQKWPDAIQKRMGPLSAERLKGIGVGPEEKARSQAFLEQNYKFFEAPVVVYLCIDRSLTPWSIFDIGMLAQSIMLAAQEYHVDSMPAVMLVSYPDLIRAELGIPEELSILFGIALGYRDPDHPRNQNRSSRRPIQEVVRFKGL